MNPAFTKQLGKFTDFIASHYSDDIAGMLIHTSIAGWIASSAAQILGIALNKKYTNEQKSFMIPQEMADAAVNIGSFFVITSSIKSLASKMVSTGKFLPKKVLYSIISHGDSSKIGKVSFNIPDVSYYKEIEKNYKSFRNFAEASAAVIGGVVSSNIVTPILRNHIASTQKGKMMTKIQGMPQTPVAIQSLPANKISPKPYTPPMNNTFSDFKHRALSV